VLEHGTGALNIDSTRIGSPSGRWPANVILDEDMAEVLDRQSGIKNGNGKVKKSGSRAIRNAMVYGSPNGTRNSPDDYGDSGGASRFFYVAKAPKKERPVVDGVAHATVKPLALMRWLVRLVTPEGGTVLEPFAGSGTTVEACILEGFNCIAIEREAEYLPLIHARIDRADHIRT
jgi:site-specific DNA-methyltransferase (adenine-specific)